MSGAAATIAAEPYASYFLSLPIFSEVWQLFSAVMGTADHGVATFSVLSVVNSGSRQAFEARHTVWFGVQPRHAHSLLAGLVSLVLLYVEYESITVPSKQVALGTVLVHFVSKLGPACIFTIRRPPLPRRTALQCVSRPHSSLLRS